MVSTIHGDLLWCDVGWPRPASTGMPDRDRRTEDRLTDAERTHNRDQAGLCALVEQSIGHLAGAWSLRRWRGLLYRWLHRIPT